MANEKISQLTNGNPALATDLIPIARGGVNFSITPSSIAALVPTPPTPIGTSPVNNDWHYINAASGQNALVYGGVGIFVNAYTFSNGSVQSIVPPTATVPTHFLMSNPGGASAGSSGGLYEFPRSPTNIFGSIILSTLVDWEVKVVLNTSFNQARYWISLTDNPAIAFSAQNTDTPGSGLWTWNNVGFRYAPSTTAHDQFWQVFLGGVVSPVIINTGVPIQTDGLPHVFGIKQPTAGTLLFFIDGVQVASHTYVGLTNGFYSFIWADNDEASTSQWAANTNYGLGAEIYDTRDGFYWIAENSGTSTTGTIPLPLGPSPGDTFNDNGIIWFAIGNGVYSPTAIGMAWLYWSSSI